MLDKIPTGFEKMNLHLIFHRKEQVDAIENEVLKMIVCGYYIFYKKEPLHDGTSWEITFFCKPDQETTIAYNIGLWAQTALDFYSKDKIDNAIHRVPDGFPECIRIK